MKLATYKDGSRDGQLVVVSRDLSTAHYATGIADTLQQALDDWNFMAPELQDLYETLGRGKARHAFPFEPRQCMAPLPRTCQRAGGAACRNHLALAYRTLDAQALADFGPEPLMYQGDGGALIGPHDDVVVASEDLGVDFESEIAVITGDLPMGSTPEQALDGIRLLMLANAVCLRHLVPAELAKGFGFFHSRPVTAFSPVAVTPDALGGAWNGGRLDLALHSACNGRTVGLCDAGPAMGFDFGQLIAQFCKTRQVWAGAIVSSGALSNEPQPVDGRPTWPKGYSCIAEKRGIETILDGQPSTAFMRFGDTLRIEMKDASGQSIFGAIEQKIAPPA